MQFSRELFFQFTKKWFAGHPFEYLVKRQSKVINVFQKCSMTTLKQYNCIRFTTKLKT